MSLATLDAQMQRLDSHLQRLAPPRATSYPHAPTRTPTATYSPKPFPQMARRATASAPARTATAEEYRTRNRIIFSTAFKSTDMAVSRAGIIESYLTVWNGPDGGEFTDDYGDVVLPGSFDLTISQLEQERKSRNSPFLCADLFQHDPNQPIGGITRLSKDSRGVIYEAKLAMGIQRAQEVYELAKNGMIGSSFGYHAVQPSHKNGKRYLHALDLIEISQVTFPANQYAPIISVKSGQWVQADELTPEQIVWRRYRIYREHALAEAYAMKKAFSPRR